MDVGSERESIRKTLREHGEELSRLRITVSALANAVHRPYPASLTDGKVQSQLSITKSGRMSLMLSAPQRKLLARVVVAVTLVALGAFGVRLVALLKAAWAAAG
jgi:hypothetical protein